MSTTPDGVDPDQLNTTARKVLLDGLEALAPQTLSRSSKGVFTHSQRDDLVTGPD